MNMYECMNMYEYEHVFPDKVSVTLPLHLTGYFLFFLFLFFILEWDYTVYIGQYNLAWPKHRQYIHNLYILLPAPKSAIVLR